MITPLSLTWPRSGVGAPLPIWSQCRLLFWPGDRGGQLTVLRAHWIRWPHDRCPGGSMDGRWQWCGLQRAPKGLWLGRLAPQPGGDHGPAISPNSLRGRLPLGVNIAALSVGRRQRQTALSAGSGHHPPLGLWMISRNARSWWRRARGIRRAPAGRSAVRIWPRHPASKIRRGAALEIEFEDGNGPTLLKAVPKHRQGGSGRRGHLGDHG